CSRRGRTAGTRPRRIDGESQACRRRGDARCRTDRARRRNRSRRPERKGTSGGRTDQGTRSAGSPALQGGTANIAGGAALVLSLTVHPPCAPPACFLRESTEQFPYKQEARRPAPVGL